MTSSNSSIPEERVGLYYFGMALSIIGVLLFMSVFLTGFRSMGGRSSSPPSSIIWVPEGQDPAATKSACGVLGFDCNAEVRTFKGKEPPSPSSPDYWGPTTSPSNGSSEMGRALTGMALIVVGGLMMNIGKVGLRGSGVILDPQGAREDLKPWNVARGGMLDDTLRSSEVVTGMVERSDNKSGDKEPGIKVRCQRCRALNDEDARFCKSCGAPL